MAAKPGDLAIIHEQTNIDCKLTILDVEVYWKPDGYRKTLVDRKPIHTNGLLDFNSCNPITHKRSVAQTLLAWEWTVLCSKADAMKEIKLE